MTISILVSAFSNWPVIVDNVGGQKKWTSSWNFRAKSWASQIAKRTSSAGHGTDCLGKDNSAIDKILTHEELGLNNLWWKYTSRYKVSWIWKI